MVTSASTSTKGFPAPAPPAPTLTNATSLDALQPTQERTTLTPQALDPPSQRLAAQAIPPEAAIEYLSKLSPNTPIDLSQLALYLHDHPDRASVDAVLTGLSQGFKIGFQGPRVSKEYPNLISAWQNPHIVSTNLLKELQLGHTAGPLVSPPFPSFQVYPIGVVIPLGLFQKSTPQSGEPFFTFPFPNIKPLASIPTLAQPTTPYTTLQ